MARQRVLIVDDNAQVRQDLHTILALAGDVEVVGEAADGQEAIQQVKALRLDVVVMDLEMPVMDGYEATRQIKALAPNCRVAASCRFHSPAKMFRTRICTDVTDCCNHPFGG